MWPTIFWALLTKTFYISVCAIRKRMPTQFFLVAKTAQNGAFDDCLHRTVLLVFLSEWSWQMGIKITLTYEPVFLFLERFALQSVCTYSIPTVKKSNMKLLMWLLMLSTYVKNPLQNHKWLIIIYFRCTINTIQICIHIRLLKLIIHCAITKDAHIFNGVYYSQRSLKLYLFTIAVQATFH